MSYADAIASIESGGNYGAVGPATRTGDHAYGKYQIMGANVGPWTTAVLGHALTPQQFLADPRAQDAVFNSEFGRLVDKYGPAGASRAWFAGEGGMNNPNAKDVGGTTVADYERRFLNAAGMPAAAPIPGRAPAPDNVAALFTNFGAAPPPQLTIQRPSAQVPAPTEGVVDSVNPAFQP